MAKRGQKPKPRDLHVVQGTDRPDRHGTGDSDPEPSDVRVGPPPHDLPEAAKRFWWEKARAADRLGVELDPHELEYMARIYVRARTADDVVQEQGSSFTCQKTGNPKRRPEAVESQQLWKELRLMLETTGIGTVGRARMEQMGTDRSAKKSRSPKDETGDFLFGSGQ